MKVRSKISASGQRDLGGEHRLFTLDRKDHVKSKIKPLLEFVRKTPGFIIIQDRGFLSAPAYQAKDKSSIEAILREQRKITPIPDLFIIVDVPLEVALGRIKTQKQKEELTEKKQSLEKARERFLWMANNIEEPVLVLDGTGEPNVNCARILDVLDIN